MKPEFQKLIYRANPDTGYFQKTFAPIGFIKIPDELKLEQPIREDYQNKGVRFILKSRMINGEYPFQTGLISTGFDRWYFGDHYHPKERMKNSFCLFRFDESSSELTIFYFNHYKLYPNKRERFISQFIQQITNENRKEK